MTERASWEQVWDRRVLRPMLAIHSAADRPWAPKARHFTTPSCEQRKLCQHRPVGASSS